MTWIFKVLAIKGSIGIFFFKKKYGWSIFKKKKHGAIFSFGRRDVHNENQFFGTMGEEGCLISCVKHLFLTATGNIDLPEHTHCHAQTIKNRKAASVRQSRSHNASSQTGSASHEPRKVVPGRPTRNAFVGKIRKYLDTLQLAEKP